MCYEPCAGGGYGYGFPCAGQHQRKKREHEILSKAVGPVCTGGGQEGRVPDAIEAGADAHMQNMASAWHECLWHGRLWPGRLQVQGREMGVFGGLSGVYSESP